MFELLHCPFCGKKPKIHRSTFSERYRVRCEDGCGAETVSFGYKEKAIKAWNTRIKIENTEKGVLSDIPTKDLVNELVGREGVRVWSAEPHETIQIKVCGPAVILEVFD